ncbi:type-F conjugative transfer system pilin assembly protein TrbC, partial [Klebsiella pneumoniae]|nr:type-F conjugative transfer system pilin assembly protein TrbC [Klebsiella pneumoniae]
RALTFSVMVAFAPMVVASAQTDISVTDHSWIKSQQDALAAMKDDLQSQSAGSYVLPQAQQDLITRLQGNIVAQTTTMGEKDTFQAIY